MMEDGSFPTGFGGDSLGGPMEFDSYRRAVYRAPPTKFYVDMLPPLKQSGHYSFGLRITPANAGDQDSFSEASFSTRSSTADVVYDVWRRWEDCLWFQEMLEQTYSRLAREKRQRLQAGKGVKKDGFYQQDKASSWESLPPGPDPNHIAKDIHEIIPKLSKKGTLFRTSQATVDQRYQQLTALMEALFDFEVSTLIKDLRTDRQVTDFFGYWRRDHDFFLKEQSKIGKSSRSSTGSTVSSLYSHRSTSTAHTALTVGSTASEADSIPYSVSAYTPELPPSLNPPPSHSSPTRGRAGSITSSSNLSSHALSLVSWHRSRKSHSRARSTASSGSSSSGDSKFSELSTPNSESTTSVFDNDRRSQYLSDYSFGDGIGLDTLSEDGSDFGRVEARYSQFLRSPQKPAGTPGDRRSRRAIQIYSPPSVHDQSSDESTVGPNNVRESWATTSTITDLLDGLNMTLPEDEECPPSPSPRRRDSTDTIQTYRTDRSGMETYLSTLGSSLQMPRPNRSRDSVATFMTTDSANAIIPREGVVRAPGARARDSVASFATFRTTDSAEAIIPRTQRGLMRRSVSSNPGGERSAAFSRPVSAMSSMSDDDEFSFGSYLDEFPMTLGSGTDESESRPTTPVARLSVLAPSRPLSGDSILPTFPMPPQGRPRSSTTSSIMSTASSSSSDSTASRPSGNNISIKVAFEESIILLRVPRTVNYADVRTRIRTKFAQQEGVELSDDFYIGFLPRQPTTPTTPNFTGRARSSSVNSTAPELKISPLASSAMLEMVTSQREWEYVTVLSAGGKLTLRIIDP